jgi:hypothetical protein
MWMNSFSVLTTHKPPQNLCQDGFATSSMEPTEASMSWRRWHEPYPTGPHTLRWCDTAVSRPRSATCSTTLKSCRPRSMPAGLDSTTVATAWKPPGFPNSSAPSRDAPPSSLGNSSALKPPAGVGDYPIVPRPAKRASQLREHLADGGVMSSPDQRLPWWQVWSNKLREEMHRRRGDRRRPPGQVDKLPSSWSVTLNAVSSV